MKYRAAYVDVGGTNTRFIVGLRGVWTAAEKKRWKKKLSSLAPHVEVVSDVELAYLRAFGKKSGILLNAGTGSIAYGRWKSKTARAGGLGPLLGDEGSAFWMGREYLRKTQKDWRVLRKIAVGSNPVAKIASFAKRAMNDKGLVKQAQADLIDLVKNVVSGLRPKQKLPLVLQGGIFQNRRFRESFKRKVRRFALPS